LYKEDHEQKQNSPSGENRTRVSRPVRPRSLHNLETGNARRTGKTPRSPHDPDAGNAKRTEELVRQGGSNNPKGGAEQKSWEWKFQEVSVAAED
jgi:hypothetical protein